MIGILIAILIQLLPFLEKSILACIKKKLSKLPSINISSSSNSSNTTTIPATKQLEILPSAPQEATSLKETTMQWILLIKTLIAAIQAIEALMGKEPGATKLDAAIAITEAVVGPVTTVLPAVQAVAATVVAGLHAAGVFTKTDGR